MVDKHTEFKDALKRVSSTADARDAIAMYCLMVDKVYWAPGFTPGRYGAQHTKINPPVETYFWERMDESHGMV